MENTPQLLLDIREDIRKETPGSEHVQSDPGQIIISGSGPVIQGTPLGVVHLHHGDSLPPGLHLSLGEVRDVQDEVHVLGVDVQLELHLDLVGCPGPGLVVNLCLSGLVRAGFLA